MLRPSLERPPCVVSFSGGRDSSCLLAAATRLAHKEGLELPVPASLRFPDAASADETSWQELVIEDLGLPEWEIIELSDGDLLGPDATALIRRHGVIWPANAHILGAVIRATGTGGSVITGLGGDEVFGTWRWRSLADLLARRRPPEPYDLLRASYAALPARARILRERRRMAAFVPDWLRPVAREEAWRRMAETAAQAPVWWQNRVRWRARGRSLLAQLETFETLGAEADKEVSAPLIDPMFIAALARAGGRVAFGDRTDTMLAVFRSIVPEPLLRRSSKATGEDLFWVGNSRRFAESWDGSGVDPELVDLEALRRQWLSPEPDGRTSLLLQAAWLHSDDRATDKGPEAARLNPNRPPL